MIVFGIFPIYLKVAYGVFQQVQINSITESSGFSTIALPLTPLRAHEHRTFCTLLAGVHGSRLTGFMDAYFLHNFHNTNFIHNWLPTILETPQRTIELARFCCLKLFQKKY